MSEDGGNLATMYVAETGTDPGAEYAAEQERLTREYQERLSASVPPWALAAQGTDPQALETPGLAERARAAHSATMREFAGLAHTRPEVVEAIDMLLTGYARGRAQSPSRIEHGALHRPHEERISDIARMLAHVPDPLEAEEILQIEARLQIVRAAHGGDTDRVRQILDLNQPDQRGTSAYHIALYAVYGERYRVLLRQRDQLADEPVTRHGPRIPTEPGPGNPPHNGGAARALALPGPRVSPEDIAPDDDDGGGNGGGPGPRSPLNGGAALALPVGPEGEAEAAARRRRRLDEPGPDSPPPGAAGAAAELDEEDEGGDHDPGNGGDDGPLPPRRPVDMEQLYSPIDDDDTLFFARMRVRTPILEAIGGLSTEGIREEAQRIFEHDTDLGQVMAMMYDRIIGGPEGQRYLGDRHFQIPNAKMLVDKWGALVRTYPDPRDAAIALAAIKMDGQNFIWDQLEGNPSLDRATIAEYHKQLRQLDEEARTSDRWGLTDLEWRVIETVWGERGELLHDQQRQYDTGPATDEANS